MKTCPFKTTTKYSKSKRNERIQYDEDAQKYLSTGEYITEQVSCNAKEAHTVEHTHGTCDLYNCPYYQEPVDRGINTYCAKACD